MPNIPLLSVIVVTYNQKTSLAETIDSIINQDYTNIEMIIADDGSREFDGNYYQDYIMKRNKKNIVKLLIYTNEQNIGTVKNINNAIRRASGKYINIIGGDDVYYCHSVFSRQVSYMEASKTLVLTGKTFACDENLLQRRDDRINYINRNLQKIFTMDRTQLYKKICKHDLCVLVTQATCYAKEVFEKIGLYDERYKYIEDLPFALRLLNNEKEISCMNSYIVKHRAGIGVSAADDSFSTRKVGYYEDLLKYVKYEMVPYKKLLGEWFVKYKSKLYEFRLAIIMCKIQKCSAIKKMRHVLRNLDALIYYFSTHPKKTIEKFISGFGR